MGYICARSHFPGPLHEANAQSDWLSHLAVSSIQETTKNHALHHQSTTALHLQIHLPHEAAGVIIRDCSAYPTTFISLPMGIIP